MVLGRSTIVGKPMAMLLQADATVTICHSGTRDLAAITPAPGGVGPMTVAMLLANTVVAASSSSKT